VFPKFKCCIFLEDGFPNVKSSKVRGKELEKQITKFGAENLEFQS
jgi:hypothetical protein